MKYTYSYSFLDCNKIRKSISLKTSFEEKFPFFLIFFLFYPIIEKNSVNFYLWFLKCQKYQRHQSVKVPTIDLNSYQKNYLSWKSMHFIYYPQLAGYAYKIIKSAFRYLHKKKQSHKYIIVKSIPALLGSKNLNLIFF